MSLLVVGRDPECMFYSGAEYTMNAYRSVPASSSSLLYICLVWVIITVKYDPIKNWYNANNIMLHLATNGQA